MIHWVRLSSRENRMRRVDAHSFRRSVTSLAEYPRLLISFSIYKGTTALFFLAPPLPTLIYPFFGEISSVTCLCAAIACSCVLFASLSRNAISLDNPLYLYGATAFLVIGICLLCFVVPFTSLPAAELVLYLVSIALTAGGVCAIHIEFGRLMGYLGATYTLIFNIAASLIGVPITAALLLMPTYIRLTASIILILCLVRLFLQSVEKIGRPRIYEVTETELVIPWRFLFTSFLQGIAIGLVITFFSARLDLNLGVQTLSILVACIAAFGFAIALRVDFDRLVYHIGFCCIGFASLVFSLASGLTRTQEIAVLLMYTAYVYLDIILWSLGSHLIKNCNQPAIWVAACPSASLMTGRLIGSLFGTIAVGESYGSAAVPTTCSFIFAAAALYLSSGNNLKNGWGFIKPNDEEGLSDREWACKLIAEDFKLTARESDVLILLASGKSRSRIAEELVVTPNTVKTHVRNVYSKLGVHSNDELQKLVAHQKQTFESH